MAGEAGTVRLDDFVIPQKELESRFLVTFNHGLRDNDTWDGTQSEERIVGAPGGRGWLGWTVKEAAAGG